MDAPSQHPLANRSFRCFAVAQFLGAFNDNLFKQLLLLLAAKWLFPGEDQQGMAAVAFALPFVLFSGIAGDLSERLSKRSVIRTMKLLEIAIMALGAVALQQRHWYGLLAVLFAMGTHSAFFGPSKYGAIPEIVAPSALMTANGLVAMTTFLSILFGQAVAGPLLDWFADRLWISGAFGVGFAVLGWLAAGGIAPLPPTRPDLKLSWSPFGNLFATIGELRRDGRLFDLVLVNSMFWFDGGVLQQAVNGLGGDRWLAIGKDENKLLSWLLATLAISIMVGCLLAPRLARVVGRARLVVLGAVCMAAGQAALILVGPLLSREHGGYLFAHVALAFTGFTGAMFVVPVQTALQDAPEPGHKGATFAVNNFCNFIGVFLAGGFYLLSAQLHVPPAVAAAVAGALLLLTMSWAKNWRAALAPR